MRASFSRIISFKYHSRVFLLNRSVSMASKSSFVSEAGKSVSLVVSGFPSICSCPPVTLLPEVGVWPSFCWAEAEEELWAAAAGAGGVLADEGIVVMQSGTPLLGVVERSADRACGGEVVAGVS